MVKRRKILRGGVKRATSLPALIKWGSVQKKYTGGGVVSIQDGINFRTPDDDVGEIMAFSDKKRYSMVPLESDLNPALSSIAGRLAKSQMRSRAISNKSGGGRRKRRRRKTRKTRTKRRKRRKTRRKK
jgi:hypothetical protein